jgi:hypothetical protein
MPKVESNPMTVTTSQGDVVIDITNVDKFPYNEVVNKVGIRISGGADSAIVAYMLALYKRDFRPNITLHPITCVNNLKPYQEIFAKGVIKKITELTGVPFEEHIVAEVDGEQYVKAQKRVTDKIYADRLVDIHFMGETMNPPVGTEEQENWQYNGGGRDKTRDAFGDVHTPVVIYRPIRNLNKKGVKELYDHFGVLDSLYPITRSCEIHTLDFSEHCGKCWFCLERHWGFGRYV